MKSAAPPIRIGVLASEIERNPTGVGRYLRGLLSHVADQRPNWRWVLYFQGEQFEDPLLENPVFEPVFLGRAQTHPVLFEQFVLPKHVAGLDAFFSPAYSLPRGLDCPSLVAIHDLSFEVLPDEFGWKERWRRRWLTRRSARSADRVLTISEMVSRQLRDLYKVEEGKLALLPLAVDASTFESLGRPPSIQLPKRFVLFAGSVLPRRRLDLVLECFAALAHEHPELGLVIAGENRLRRREDLDLWIQRHGVSDRVTKLGWVEDEELIWLLRNAEFSYYLSAYEGYGLPPMEALAVGTPVVVATGLALDHLWPQYPYRCKQLTREEVLRVSRRVLDDPDERQSVSEEGARLVAGLSWARAAEMLIDEIEAVVAG